MGKRLKLTCGLLLITLLVSGCAEKKETPVETKTSHQTALDELQEKAVSVTPEPRRDHHSDLTVLEDEYEPTDTTGQPLDTAAMPHLVQKTLPRMPVTMKMHDISLPIIIRTLARVADLDIMLTDTVQGRTSLAVTEVPWNQAFQGILDTFGLTYEWSGDILRVLSVEDIQKKQALMEARQTFETTRNQHELAVMAQEKMNRKLQPLVTQIVKIHYADLEELQKNLTRYLSPESGGETAPQPAGVPGMPGVQILAADTEDEYSGNILMDKFSNSLIIHATREDIRKLLPIIRRIDRPIRQVLIEAHIVEAESNTGKELGVQWGGLGTADAGRGKSYSIGGNMVEAGNSLADGYTPTDGNIVDLPLSSAASGSGLALGVLAQKAGEFMLYSQLLALEQEGKLNILSTPSITTMDHRKATIKSGREVPYQTVVDGEVSIEWQEAVVKLEVTPHIVNNRIVRLEIVTEKDELDFDQTGSNGDPTIITKNAETNVMLFDGQTTVIGGLNKEKTDDDESGVPGLRKAPGLSWLFKSISKQYQMEELLIFITPRILKGATSLSEAGRTE